MVFATKGPILVFVVFVVSVFRGKLRVWFSSNGVALDPDPPQVYDVGPGSSGIQPATGFLPSPRRIMSLVATFLLIVAFSGPIRHSGAARK